MDVQWGNDHVYKVGGRMFLATMAASHSCSLKVSDIAYEALTETGRAIPAPYLARAKWVKFEDFPSVHDDEMRGLLAQAHALVAAKLTRRLRRELGLD